MLRRYKLVVKDSDGKVKQIHEVYRSDLERLLLWELDSGHRVTVTELQR